MQKHHYRIGNAPKAHVYTNAPKTLKTLFKQRVRWAYGFLKNAYDYRGVYFKPAYGNLGMFILPNATVAIGSAFFFAGSAIMGIINIINREVLKIQAIGFSTPGMPSFDWFYLKTHSAILLTILVIAMTLSIIVIGKRLMGEKHALTRDVACYIALYGLLAPLWLTRAVYNVAFSRQKSWADEINERRQDKE